jgi:hypothetical protein
LVIGQLSLVVAARIYQQSMWEDGDLAAELAEIAEWKALLTEIAVELQRLTLT